MKSNARKTISILMIMLMIMPFTWQVFADDTLPEDQDTAADTEAVQPEPEAETAAEKPAAPASSESAAAQIPESSENAAMQTPEASEAKAGTAAEEVAAEPEPYEPAEQDTAESAAAPEPSGPEEDPKDTAPAPAVAKAAYAPAPAAAASVRTAAQTDKTITIAGTKLNCTADSSGSGWTYEKDSGRIVLRDYTDSADITSDGTGVDIVSTGLNRIGTLSCDGDINVIGTGILLIDKVELAEGCSFNLLPLKDYYGEDGGSVAVFLKQDDESYMLINGTVKGIVDENYKIEDVKLVLPENSYLELQALGVVVETDEDGNETIIRDYSGFSEEELKAAAIRYYIANLKVNDLTVKKGATIKLNRVSDVIISSLKVVGSLVNDGVINGGLVDAVGYSGSGIIENSIITLSQGQTTSIKLRDANVSLERGDYTLNELNITGNCELYYEGNVELKKIKSSSNGSLSIYSRNIFNDNRIVKITDEIEKVSVVIKSAITELEADLKVNEATVSNQTYGGPVFDYSGKGAVSYGINGSVYLGPKDIIMPEADSIPVVSLALLDTRKPLLYYTWEENVNEEEVYTQLADYNVSEKNEEGLITYTDLLSAYVPEEILSEFGVSPFLFEVLRCKNGRLSMTILGYGYQQSTDADGVFLIRKVVRTATEENIGGSAMTTTHASQLYRNRHFKVLVRGSCRA